MVHMSKNVYVKSIGRSAKSKASTVSVTLSMLPNVSTNMDLNSQMLNDYFQDFYSKGFQIFDGKKYSDQLDVSQIVWQYEGGVNNDYHPSNNIQEVNHVLLNIHYEISSDILDKNFARYSIEKRRIWQGVNKDATAWHNDLGEGPNCFFLLYHSDMIDDGFVHFRNSQDTFQVVPKEGLLVAVNCDIKFQHRADVSKNSRVTSSYFFNLEY